MRKGGTKVAKNLKLDILSRAATSASEIPDSVCQQYGYHLDPARGIFFAMQKRMLTRLGPP